MPETPLPLILNSVEWLAVKRRSEADGLGAWRKSCPRPWPPAAIAHHTTERIAASGFLIPPATGTVAPSLG